MKNNNKRNRKRKCDVHCTRIYIVWIAKIYANNRRRNDRVVPVSVPVHLCFCFYFIFFSCDLSVCLCVCLLIHFSTFWFEATIFSSHPFRQIAKKGWVRLFLWYETISLFFAVGRSHNVRAWVRISSYYNILCEYDCSSENVYICSKSVI